jgi:hypothetical protein
VDAAALWRAAVDGEELCEIAGVGPVPVATARRKIGEALFKVVVTDGVHVRAVVHPTRTVASVIKTALLWQHPECCVAGCHQVHGLQAHHTKEFATTRHTRLDELVLICPFHHHLLTADGFGLSRRPDGDHDLVPPEQLAPANRRGPPDAEAA